VAYQLPVWKMLEPFASVLGSCVEDRDEAPPDIAEVGMALSRTVVAAECTEEGTAIEALSGACWGACPALPLAMVSSSYSRSLSSSSSAAVYWRGLSATAAVTRAPLLDAACPALPRPPLCAAADAGVTVTPVSPKDRIRSSTTQTDSLHRPDLGIGMRMERDTVNPPG